MKFYVYQDMLIEGNVSYQHYIICIYFFFRHSTFHKSGVSNLNYGIYDELISFIKRFKKELQIIVHEYHSASKNDTTIELYQWVPLYISLIS